jgi:hypothetical protein
METFGSFVLLFSSEFHICSGSPATSLSHLRRIRSPAAAATSERAGGRTAA